MTAPHYTYPDIDAAQRFIDRLRALTPEQWEGLARSLDPWRGDEVRAVWRRARRGALYVSDGALARDLFGIFGTVGALVRELFDEGDPIGTAALLRRGLSDLPPARRAEIEQMADLLEVAEQALPGDRVAASAINLAATALKFRPNWRPSHFAEAYAPLGPFVPADSVSDVA